MAGQQIVALHGLENSGSISVGIVKIILVIVCRSVGNLNLDTADVNRIADAQISEKGQIFLL